MKPLIAILCLISTVAFAQNPPTIARPLNMVLPPNEKAPGEALPENYLLTLVVSEKDQVLTELSIVLATTDFNVAVADPVINFSGILTSDDKEGMLVRYTLNTQVAISEKEVAKYFRNGSVQASVKVRVGEPLQIFKSGTQTYKLTISRLPTETHKSK
jgi:hypothetical protein